MERDEADEDWGCFGGLGTTRVLGRGGMGIVYEARRPGRRDRLAVKVLRRSLAQDPLARARFGREGRALARVRHAHVVALLGAGIEEEQPYLVLELLEGETLAARLARQGRLELPELVAVFAPLLSAVAASHRCGVIHRDLKPANVVLAPQRPVLIDFGISRLVEPMAPEAALTVPDALIGTPRCLSPEQIWNPQLASPLSDQYALGVMLYECATGRQPFSGASHFELMDAILRAPLPPPSRHAPVPPELDRLVLRALSRDRAGRFADVSALAQALAALGPRGDGHQSPCRVKAAQ
jgi:serine/threonine protein kinase